MSKTKSKSSARDSLPLFITGVLFFVSLYLIILKWIRPAYLYVKQMPVFLPTARGIKEAMSYPGGLIDFLSSGLTLYFTDMWKGAFILTLCCALVFFLLFGILRTRVLCRGFWALPFLPVIALAMMLTNYARPLADTVSLVLALGLFWIFRQAREKAWTLRLVLMIGLGLVLYYLTPGGFLVFLALVVAAQIPILLTQKQSMILVALAALMGWLLPTIAYKSVFLISQKEAFFIHLPFMQREPAWMPFILFQMLLLGSVLFASIRMEPKSGRESSILNHIAVVAGMVVLIPVLNALLTCGTTNRIERKIHEIRFLAHEQQWRDLLRAVDLNAIRHITSMTLINQALYQTNQLASNMFAFGQAWETSGLTLPRDIAYEYPLDHSLIMYELGHVTEAERWALEALVLYGQTPWVLERLALINIVQEDWSAAEKYLLVLQKIGPTREWAERYLDLVRNPEHAQADYWIQQLKALRPTDNFVTSIQNPQMDFMALLEQNPENRMAYEYLMAYAMLAKDFTVFARYLPRYKDFNQTGMPRHYQEALLVYVSQKGKVHLPGFVPDATIVQRFRQFAQIAQRARSTGSTGFQQLKQQFGDTYWYYLIYTQIGA